MCDDELGRLVLPTGKVTKSFATYHSAWSQWATKLEKRLLVKVRQVDPDFLVEDTKQQGRIFTIPTWVAERIITPKKPRRPKPKK